MTLKKFLTLLVLLLVCFISARLIKMGDYPIILIPCVVFVVAGALFIHTIFSKEPPSK